MARFMQPRQMLWQMRTSISIRLVGLSKENKKRPDKGPLFLKMQLGAGGENRTRITCLEGTYISHYTTPA